jgi:RNA polymerase sigma-70 factor (sigma-E family)
MMVEVVTFRAGDGDLRDLFEAHYAGLVRLAAILVDDLGTAEEVVQDAFVATYARRSAVAGDSAVAYLRSAVLNGARSALRRRGTARRFLARQRSARTAAAPTSPETAAVSSLTRRAVLEAIRGLPDRQRDVVMLRYFLDASEAQIAETLGVSAGTVKTSASRALAKLAPLLEDFR